MFRWQIFDTTTGADRGTIDTSGDDESEARALHARSLGHRSDADRVEAGGPALTFTRAGSASVPALFNGKPHETFDPASWPSAAASDFVAGTEE